MLQLESGPYSLQLEKTHGQQQRASAVKKKTNNQQKGQQLMERQRGSRAVLELASIWEFQAVYRGRELELARL